MEETKRCALLQLLQRGSARADDSAICANWLEALDNILYYTSRTRRPGSQHELDAQLRVFDQKYPPSPNSR